MKTLFKSIYLFSFAIILASSSCSNNENVGADEVSAAHIDPDNPPVMTFKTPNYNFGTISQGQVIKYAFVFTNTGKSDLVIQSVQGSCGCTVPKSWPKKPIKPGDNGTIDVQFDSEGKQGEKNVTVTILANTVPTKNIVTLTGTVVVPNEN